MIYRIPFVASFKKIEMVQGLDHVAVVKEMVFVTLRGLLNRPSAGQWSGAPGFFARGAATDW